MKKVISALVLVFTIGQVTIGNANLRQDECEELGALVFVGSIQRGMDPIEAYDLAMWARQDCENNFQ